MADNFGFVPDPDEDQVPTARQADVQLTYIEKAQPVTPVEMEVRRAVPIRNPFGFVPETPAAPDPYVNVPTFAPQTVTPEAPDAMSSPEAYGQQVSTGELSPEQWAQAQKTWETPAVKLPRVKAGDISASGQPLSNFDAAAVNTARGFVSGVTSLQGLFGLLPPVGLAEVAANAPQLVEQVKAADQTPAGSQQRWEAGLAVVTTLGTLGLLGKGTVEMARAFPGMPEPTVTPETGPQPGLYAYPGRPGAPPEMPPPGAGWQKQGNVWVKVDPAGDVTATHPAEFGFVPAELPAPQLNLPAPEAPTAPFEAVTPGETQAPAATGMELALPETANTIEGEWQKLPDETRTAITDELAAQGHSPEAIAQMTPMQAATTVLRPPPGPVQQEEPAGPVLPMAQPGENAGNAWQSMAFLDQDRIKGELASLGYEPDQIENMTRSQLDATRPAREAARQAPPVPTEAPTAPQPATVAAGVSPAAPAAPAVGDLVAFKMPAVVKGQRGTMRAAGTIQRILPNGKLAVRLQQGGYHQIDPSEIISSKPGAAPAAVPYQDLFGSEAERAQQEHQREMQEELRAGGLPEYQRGPELWKAVVASGGLPSKNAPSRAVLRGELDALEESIRGSRGRIKGIPSPVKLFRKDAPTVQVLVKNMRDLGFNVESGSDIIDLLHRHLDTGIPIYGHPEHVEAISGYGPRVGETPPAPSPHVPAVQEKQIQTFLDFNQVPAARKAESTQDIKNTLALAGDPALQQFYQSGFGVPGHVLARALHANKNRVSIIYADMISRERPTWNIEGSIIANAADLATAVQPIRSPDFESFKVVVRDPVTKKVLAAEIISSGTVNETILHPRDYFRALARLKEKYPNAEVLDVHNHPSGFPKPSSADRDAWRKMDEAAAVQGVPVVDHVISNGHQYFSLSKEELTGDGFGLLPNPVKAPWEVVRQEESPKIDDPHELAKYAASLRADDPNATHVFYVGTQYNLKAVERVTNGTNLPAIKQAIANGISRESAFAVLVDFAQPPPRPAMINLVNSVHDAMGAKFLDASWPGMNSARENGGYALREEPAATTVAEEPYGGRGPIQRQETAAASAGAAGEAAGGAIPRLAPLSEMERTTLQTLRRAKGTLTAAGKRKLARLEARGISQGELLGNEVFNLSGEQGIDWVARARQAEAEEAVKAQAEQAAQKAQMSLFEKPDMPYVTGTARVNESNGAGKPPSGPPGASMFAPDTPPRSNPLPVWARRAGNKFLNWWLEKLPRSYEIVRKVPESPAITEHQRLLESELSYMNNFANAPWWQAIRRRPEEELIDLEHHAVTTYRNLLAGGMPRESAWSRAVGQMPPDVQALFQHRESRVPLERWAAAQLAVDEPSYTGDPYLARLTNEEGKNVVDLHPQIANWGRHIRQSIGSFDKSRVHATMKEGISHGTQYEPPTMAAFVRELYSIRLERTARMLQTLKDKGVLFDEKADAIAANNALKKDAGPVTLVRGFGGKDYWARSRAEAQFLAQNLNTTNGSGSIGKLVRVANAFARNPNLIFNPLPHATKNMAFKYALARVGNYGLGKSAREFGTDAQMRARFEAVMPMPTTGARLPQLRALEAGTYLERILAKGGKWLSGNHLSARFNFAKADPALRYALWKSYVKKGLSDQAAANHVWVDLIRYDENSGALNFWKGIPFNFFATWRLGTYVSLAKQLLSHPIRSLLFIGAVEYLREILYRKYGWWTHLPVDYVDAPLAQAIQDPRTIPGVAATTLLFGPGGGQAPSTIQDVMKAIHGDPGQKARVVNMFWGLSQLFNIPQEFSAYMKDKDPRHLALILSSAAFATHSALKYEPHRLMQWLPESMPGMEKSAMVRQAEALQAKIQATQEKARGTYEARHGVSASFQAQTEEGQMQALRRAAGVHPPPPGPPKRTHIIPARRSSGKPRGF